MRASQSCLTGASQACSAHDRLHMAHIASCRPLAPPDFASLKAAHNEMFPIDYEDSFFESAVHSSEGIFSWAATARCASCSSRNDTMLASG